MAAGGRSAGSPATAFRVVLLVLCSALSAVADESRGAAIPIGVLTAFAFLAETSAVLRRRPVVAGTAEAVFTGLAVAFTGGPDSALLPYLLVPSLAIGLAGTWREVLIVTSGAVGGLTAGALADDGAVQLQDFVVASGQWTLLGLAFGLVAGWAQRLTATVPVPDVDRYDEARSLLEQLRGVTHRLPGGLDVSSSADALLDSCSEVAASSRSAVLVQPSTGALVPAAIRGTSRVPWRTPLSEPGPLRQAWTQLQPVVDRRRPDTHGRRHGSSLLVLPLATADGPFGLVILESFDDQAFSDADVEALRDRVERGSLRLETAMLFDEVRSTVTVEERDRLAREMHDGVAQELAFVGYQLDDLRGQAAKVDPGLYDGLTEVRRGLTGLISDIRLSITDLRTSVSNDRGLGAALAGYVRAVGSGQQLAVHVSLQESSFRLTGEQEVALFQIAQAVAQDVRRSRQAANLWVTLQVDPPSARLLVEHDGELEDLTSLDLSSYEQHLTRLGGTLQVTRRLGAGVCVEAVLEGGSRDGRGPADR